MNEQLQNIVDAFVLADDDELRLQMLLDFARKLPEIPERFRQAREEGLNRVEECMTPVFLWVEVEDGCIRLFVDVAEEAPTVKGILGILHQALDGMPVEQIAEMPADLLSELCLQNQIRMNRAVGVNAIINRIRREVAAAVAKGPA